MFSPDQTEIRRALIDRSIRTRKEIRESSGNWNSCRKSGDRMERWRMFAVLEPPDRVSIHTHTHTCALARAREHVKNAGRLLLVQGLAKFACCRGTSIEIDRCCMKTDYANRFAPEGYMHVDFDNHSGKTPIRECRCRRKLSALSVSTQSNLLQFDSSMIHARLQILSS